MERVCKLYLNGTAITELPTSIEHLTGLASLSLRDCKSLVCLPITIFNIKFLKDVDISECSKLDKLPENLGNAESVEELNLSGTAIRQGLPPPSNLRYDIVIPGSEIPEWFSHQSLGTKLNIKEPYSHLCNELMGIAACVVFCSQEHHPHHQINSGIGIETFTHNPRFKVKKCGLRVVYKKDIEGLNRTRAQCSNYSITPYEGLDVLHPNFNNSTVLPEVNEVKRSRDDYDGAGPSGEGSSNGVPHQKCILRLTDSMIHGNSDFEGLSPQYPRTRYDIIIPGSEIPRCQIGIKIAVSNSSFKVKKCRLRVVYKKDIEGLNRTRAQCSNNSTPYEGLDVLHPNFNNSAVLAEVNEVKQSRDDYDGAGPSGEGSSNDVPHPKSIQRLTESMTHGNSDREDSSDST
uniref:C-JID domain-containing protein n=1 Tax=Fagus sylvatica TaxID=28930 RepID=A0A2N9G7Q2_FAGSY